MRILIIVLLSVMMGFTANTFGQEKSSKVKLPKTQVAHIKTSTICGSCKKRIEGILNYETGIIYAELDLDTKILEVKYKTKKISLEEIRYKIAEIGYDADDVKAIEASVEKLPACCQPGGHD